MDWIVPTAIVANTVLLLGGMIVGGKLLFPTAKRLAAHIDRALGQRDDAPRLSTQLEQVTNELIATREELSRLTERQRFLEQLLEKRSPSPTLPPT